MHWELCLILWHMTSSENWISDLFILCLWHISYSRVLHHVHHHGPNTPFSPITSTFVTQATNHNTKITWILYLCTELCWTPIWAKQKWIKLVSHQEIWMLVLDSSSLLLFCLLMSYCILLYLSCTLNTDIGYVWNNKTVSLTFYLILSWLPLPYLILLHQILLY